MPRFLTRVVLLIVYFGVTPYLGSASTIVPPPNPGGLVQDSEHVVVARALGEAAKLRGRLLVTVTRFEIVQSVKGFAAGRIVEVEAPGGVSGDIGLVINGSPQFEMGSTYLLFLREDDGGRLRPTMLSYGVMSLVDGIQNGVFVPVDQTWDLELLPRRDARPVETIRPYRSGVLLSHLRAVAAGSDWNAVGLLADDYPSYQGGGIIENQIPLGCSYLSYEGIPVRWNRFDVNEPVSFYIPDNATNFQQTSVQVSLISWSDLDEFRFGGKLNYAGKRSFTPNCAEYESAAEALLDESGNFLIGDGMVQFNDPCEEIPDLTPSGGALAFGGTFFFLNTHSYNGLQWRTSALAYVVVNNGSESYLGPIQYNQMMAHELGHTLGFGHHTTSPALMNAFCCNALSEVDKGCAVLPYGDLPPNDPPVVANPLDPITLYYPGASFVKNLTTPVPVFTDPDGDQLVFSVLSTNEGIVFADMATANAIRLTPNSVGEAVVLVRAADPRGAFVTIELTVKIEPKVNILPEVIRQPAAVSINEGAVYVLEMEEAEPYVIDKDGDKLVYSVGSLTPNIVSGLVDGTQVRALGLGPGQGRLLITADDQSGGSVQLEWAISVNGKPRVLVQPQPITITAQGAQRMVDLLQPRLFEDPEGSPLTYSITNTAALYYDAVLDGVSLVITPKQSGSGQITVTARDPAGNSNSVSIQVTVLARPNQNPVVANQPQSLQLNAGSDATLINLEGENPFFTDPDADPLSYSAISSQNRVVSASTDGPILSLLPGETGTAVVTVFATDQFGGFASVNIQVGVGLGVSLDEEPIPEVFDVGNAYPNPFNPSTVIPIRQASHDEVTIQVFDVMGRAVYTRRLGVLQPGNHLAELTLESNPSGVYLVVVRSGGSSIHQRVTLRK